MILNFSIVLTQSPENLQKCCDLIRDLKPLALKLNSGEKITFDFCCKIDNNYNMIMYYVTANFRDNISLIVNNEHI